MKKFTLLLVAYTLMVTTASAQKIKKKEGDLKTIKGQTELNVVFVYDDMKVGKNLSEEEYIERKVEEYNKKEAGTGDRWREAWVNDRENRFEPKFLELFNKYASDAKIEIDTDIDTEYTLQVHTYYTEPGFNVGVVRKPALIHVRYIIIESESGDVIAMYEQEKVPGSQAGGYDFDTGTRISESYAKAGKSFGKLVAKELK